MLKSWSSIKKILLKLLTVWVKILKENFESLIEFEELKPNGKELISILETSLKEKTKWNKNRIHACVFLYRYHIKHTVSHWEGSLYGISLGLKQAWPWWKPAPWSLALIISIPSSESLSWWCWGLPGWLMLLSRLIEFLLTQKFEYRVHCQVSEVEVSNTESLAFSEQWERKLDWICQLEERLASELRYWLVPV